MYTTPRDLTLPQHLRDPEQHLVKPDMVLWGNSYWWSLANSVDGGVQSLSAAVPVSFHSKNWRDWQTPDGRGSSRREEVSLLIIAPPGRRERLDVWCTRCWLPAKRVGESCWSYRRVWILLAERRRLRSGAGREAAPPLPAHRFINEPLLHSVTTYRSLRWKISANNHWWILNVCRYQVDYNDSGAT